MSRLRLMGVAAVGVLLGACHFMAPDMAGHATLLPYRLLHSSSVCGSDAPSVHRIADRRELNSVATSPMLGATAPPSPDFETSLVLRVSMGQQPSAGAQFGVTGVRAYGAEQRLVIDTMWNPPDPGRMHATVVTHPCVIISVDMKTGSVRHVQALDQTGQVRASSALPPGR